VIRARMFVATLAMAFVVVACFSGGQVGGRAPEFRGIANWINSEPLTLAELQGKVVLVDFCDFFGK